MEFPRIGFSLISNLDLYSLAQCISLQQRGQIFGGILCVCLFYFFRALFFFFFFLKVFKSLMEPIYKLCSGRREDLLSLTKENGTLFYQNLTIQSKGY